MVLCIYTKSLKAILILNNDVIIPRKLTSQLNVAHVRQLEFEPRPKEGRREYSEKLGRDCNHIFKIINLEEFSFKTMRCTSRNICVLPSVQVVLPIVIHLYEIFVARTGCLVSDEQRLSGTL